MGSWVDPHSSAARSSCDACPASSTRRSRGSAGSCSSQVSPASARPGWRSRFSIRPAEGEPGPPSARAGMAPERQACGRGCRSCGRSGWRSVTSVGSRPGPGHDALTRLLDERRGRSARRVPSVRGDAAVADECVRRPAPRRVARRPAVGRSSVAVADGLPAPARGPPAVARGRHVSGRRGGPTGPPALLPARGPRAEGAHDPVDRARQRRHPSAPRRPRACRPRRRRRNNFAGSPQATRSSSSSPSRSATRRSRWEYGERSTAASTPSVTPSGGSSSSASLVGREAPDDARRRRHRRRRGGGRRVRGDRAVGVDASATEGQHTFVHDLVRESMRDRLSPEERRALCASIVRGRRRPGARRLLVAGSARVPGDAGTSRTSLRGRWWRCSWPRRSTRRRASPTRPQGVTSRTPRSSRMILRSGRN